MQDITILSDLTAIDGQPMTTSRKVAKRLKKAHKNVLQSIRSFLQSAPDEFASRNFALCSYVDHQNKKQPEYRMTHDGAATLAARLKQPWGASAAEAPPTVRPEFVFGEEIVERLFSGYTIIRQFPVFGGKYRIDWYIPELRLAVEFDEAHHTTPANAAADAARQAEIESALNCRFLRYRASRQHSALTKLPDVD